MAGRLRTALFASLAATLAATALPGCGGGEEATPEACRTHPPLPVRKISYPSDSAPVGANASVVPTIDVTTGDGLDGAILQFDLVGGALPTGLSLNPFTGRISGTVGGSSGSFSYTVRVSAQCFTGSVTTSAVFLVSAM